MDKLWDAFICHASEDKQEVVEPLAHVLEGHSLHVWYDRWVLTIGDSLRRKIDEGLVNSRYGIVVLSPTFFQKEWPQRELDGLVQREVTGQKIILPVWHNVTRDHVAAFSPILADRLAGSTINGIPLLAEELARAIGCQQTQASLQPFTNARGFCYLNKEEIDSLCSKFGVYQNEQKTYRAKVDHLVTYLEGKGFLTRALEPAAKSYVYLSSTFMLVEDDEVYLSFRPEKLAHVRMSMNKLKSSFWPYPSKMPEPSHVRIAMRAGVELEVFGEWYTSDYLRPHAATVVGENLGYLNTLS